MMNKYIELDNTTVSLEGVLAVGRVHGSQWEPSSLVIEYRGGDRQIVVVRDPDAAYLLFTAALKDQD